MCAPSIVAALACLVVGVTASVRKPGLEDSPHIMLIVADDMGWNDVGKHSNQHTDSPFKMKTPNIDRLMDEGLELRNHFTQSVCSPTRASLMTGRYPSHTGIGPKVITPCAAYATPASERFLSMAMKMNGYRTYMLGKWHLGQLRPRHTPVGRGFDEHVGLFLGEGDYFTHYRKLATRGLWKRAPNHVVAYDFWDVKTNFWNEMFKDPGDPSHNRTYYKDEDYQNYVGTLASLDNEPPVTDEHVLSPDAADARYCKELPESAAPDGHATEDESSECMNENYATFIFADEFTNEETGMLARHVDDRPMFVVAAFTAPHEGQNLAQEGKAGSAGGIGGNAVTLGNQDEYTNQTPEGVWRGVDYGDSTNGKFYESMGWGWCSAIDPNSNKEKDMIKKSRCEYATMVYALDQAIGEMRQAMEKKCADPATGKTVAMASSGCNSSHWDNTVVVFLSDNGGYNQQEWVPFQGRKGVARNNGNNWPFFGYKTTLFEGGIHVPALIKGTTALGSTQGRIHESWVGQQYVHSFHVVDWFKTLVDASGKADEAGLSKYRERGNFKLDSVSHWSNFANERAESTRPRSVTILQATGTSNGARTSGALRMVHSGKEYKLMIANDALRIKQANQELVLPDGTTEAAPNNAQYKSVKFSLSNGKRANFKAWLFDVSEDISIEDLERVNLLRSPIYQAIAQRLFTELERYELLDTTVVDLATYTHFARRNKDKRKYPKFNSNCVRELKATNGQTLYPKSEYRASFVHEYNQKTDYDGKFIAFATNAQGSPMMDAIDAATTPLKSAPDPEEEDPQVSPNPSGGFEDNPGAIVGVVLGGIAVIAFGAMALAGFVR